MSAQEGASTPLHPDPPTKSMRPVTNAHAQLTSAPAVASTLAQPRVMTQSHAPLPTRPPTTMAVEPTPRVVASSGTPAVQQPLLTPGFPPLPSFQCPFSTASPRHATVSADNARPGLMERFTAPQLQYPRPTLSQTLSMHAAMPPPRMSPLGGSAITGDAYTQRHGLPGSLDARLVSTPTATATKAAQHQAPPPSKSNSSSFESEEHSNSAAGIAIWYDGEATRRMEECDDIHMEITDLYNMTEATVQTHMVQSARQWPQPRSPHGPWSRENSASPSPLRQARRSLHSVEDGTDVSGSPSCMSLTLSEETRRRMDMLREADKSDDDTSVDELLRETWQEQEQEILAGGRPQRYHSHIGAYHSSPSDYTSDPAVSRAYARYAARSAGNDFTYAPAVKQKTPKKRKASAGRSTKKALTTLEQLQKRRVGHGVHRKYNVLPLNTRVKIVGNARTDPAVIGKEGRIVNSSMGWHAIRLADGTEVRLQTSGIKQLLGGAAGAGTAAMQTDDVGEMYDYMSDGSDADFTPDPSLLLSSRASAPASALKQPHKLSKQQQPSSMKTALLSTVAVTEPSKKLALNPALEPKPVKSTSALLWSGSGRQSASGNRKSAPTTFAERTQVIVIGNKRTNAKLIGREAVVLECKPTGWHTIQMNDTSEIANVQGNALQLCSPDTVSRLSGNAAPIIRTPLVTAHTVVATPDADFRTPSGVPLVFPPPTSPDSRVSTPAIAHAVQPEVVRLRTEELPEVGQPNWTPATQTPAAAGRSISSSHATPSAVENVVGVAGDTTLQRRLSYGTPGRGQRGDDHSEATKSAMEVGAGERTAFWSAQAPGSTDARAVGTTCGGAAAAEEPLNVDSEDLKRQMKTWKAVRELHIQGAGLQSAVASPNGTARRLALLPPASAPSAPSAPKERSRKQKLPTSSCPMGPTPHEAQLTAAKLAPKKLAPKRTQPKQNNKPAPKQLAPRPPAWAAVSPLAVPAAPQQQCPQHQCNRPSIASLTKEEFMRDLFAFWVEQGVHKSLKYEPNMAWVAPKLNGSALDVFGLYSGVCKRGGFDNHMGINWTGQIFKEMENYTEDNRQTGVGSSLKRHYSKLLLAYERAHSSDIVQHPCTVCGRKDNPTDGEWICCARCDGWVHFCCDHRYKGQSFRQFVQGHADYSCEECVTGTKRQRRY